MTFTSFLKLVEIQTKVASLIPFLFGSLYVYYRFNTFSIENAFILFGSMIIFDMTTTTINNYMDYKKAIKKEGYGYEIHNAIVAHALSPRNVRILIGLMLVLSSLLGLLLVSKTNIIILLLGVICFLIGIGYSYGPLPISRTPFGEIFSGVTMGFILTFISIYIHIFNQDVINLSFISSHLEMFIDLSLLLSLVIITLPLVAGISNIMLANNICDMKDDLVNNRYTLPICIGKETALLLFFALYAFSYFAIILGVFLNVLPIFSLLTLLTIKPVLHHVKLFTKNQDKKETFVLSVKNFILINTVYIITILLAIIF